MSDTAYIATPAGLTAHSFDGNGKLHSLPAGRLPVGEDDLRALDEAVSGDEKGTQYPRRVLTRYLSGEGGSHLSVLGRVHHVEGADLMISESCEPSHPALTSADIALIDLAKHREVRVP